MFGRLPVPVRSVQEMAVPETLRAPVEPLQEQQEAVCRPADLVGDLDTVISQLERLQQRVSGLRRAAQLRQQRSRQVRQQTAAAASR